MVHWMLVVYNMVSAFLGIAVKGTARAAAEAGVLDDVLISRGKGL